MRLKEHLQYVRKFAKQGLDRNRIETANDIRDFKQYKENDIVSLDSHKRKKGISPKLQQKFTGPHKIVKIYATFKLSIRNSDKKDTEICYPS